MRFRYNGHTNQIARLVSDIAVLAMLAIQTSRRRNKSKSMSGSGCRRDCHRNTMRHEIAIENDPRVSTLLQPQSLPLPTPKTRSAMLAVPNAAPTRSSRPSGARSSDAFRARAATSTTIAAGALNR